MDASWLKGSDRNSVDSLSDVGLNELGFFGLVIVGVGSQDLDAILLTGIFIALDHALHELIVLEYHTGDGEYFLWAAVCLW